MKKIIFLKSHTSGLPLSGESLIYVQPFRSSGPERKKIFFFIFFLIMEKLYMQRQYDAKKAQLELVQDTNMYQISSMKV